MFYQTGVKRLEFCSTGKGLALSKQINEWIQEKIGAVERQVRWKKWREGWTWCVQGAFLRRYPTEYLDVESGIEYEARETIWEPLK